MNHFKKFMAVLFILFSVPAWSASFVAGKDYTVLSKKIRNNPKVAELISQDPGDTKLFFFFSYGCSACAKFDPSLEQWIKSKTSNVQLYGFPVTFEDEWRALAKLYFTVKTLDPKQDLSPKIFAAIHQDGAKLWQEDQMKQFFVANGYNAEDFEKVYDSYSTNLEVQKANDIINACAIMSTPTLIVNGLDTSYMLTPAQSGGDYKKFFAVLDYLIAKKD